MTDALRPHVYVVRGDLSRLAASVVVIPTSREVKMQGRVVSSLTHKFGKSIAQVCDAVRATLKQPTELVHWQPLELSPSDPHGPYGVVFVESVAPWDDDVGALKKRAEAAVTCAAENLRNLPEPDDSRRRLIAFPAIAVGTGGGAKGAYAHAKAQLEGICTALDRHKAQHVDVAIITYDGTSYERFVSVREQLGPAIDPSIEHHDQTLREVAQRIRAGKCLLFVGAGLSMSVGLPGWKGLLCELLDANDPRKADVAEPFADLLKLASELFPDKVARNRKIKETLGKDALASRSLSVSQFLLLQQSFPYVFTTNFDSLLEQTLDALRYDFSVAFKANEIPEMGGRRRTSIVKLHGDADGGEIVLNEAEYQQYEQSHAAPSALIRGLLLNHDVLFVGYSLSDPDFQKIVQQVQEMVKGHERKLYVMHSAGQQEKIPHAIVSVEFQGANGVEFDRLARALDRLAVLSRGSAQTLLGHHETTAHEVAHAYPHLEALQKSLKDVCTAVDSAIEQVGELSLLEVDAVSQLLATLEHLGWNAPGGKGSELGGMWRVLGERAEQLGDRERAVRSYRHALRTEDDADRRTALKKKLEATA